MNKTKNLRLVICWQNFYEYKILLWTPVFPDWVFSNYPCLSLAHQSLFEYLEDCPLVFSESLYEVYSWKIMNKTKNQKLKTSYLLAELLWIQNLTLSPRVYLIRSLVITLVCPWPISPSLNILRTVH